MASFRPHEAVSPAAAPRILPLLDPKAQPPSWSERMADGEFAVLFEGDLNRSQISHDDFVIQRHACAVLSSLAAAKAFAEARVLTHPAMRCRIYDHEGLGKAPVAEIRGERYRGALEVGPKLRRWLGSFLFFGGLALFTYDWQADFRYTWPGLLGAKFMVPGAVLLFMEAMILMNAARARRAEGQA